MGEDLKCFLLTSASLLALVAASPTASATTVLFSGAVADFTIPVAGTYQIAAFGAQGGSSKTTRHSFTAAPAPA